MGNVEREPPIPMSARSIVRPPAVSGFFYPAAAGGLESAVHECVEAAPAVVEAPVAAVIAPHAGYAYSGLTAGCAFGGLRPMADEVTRVVVVGPSHHVAFEGIALSGADAFATPLGTIAVDRDAEARLLARPCVRELPEAHRLEHCIEVELPFLQTMLGTFELVPLVVGDVTGDLVGAVLAELATEGTLLVVSTDLSHFHDYETARRLDSRTCAAIEGLTRDLRPDEACGAHAFNGLRWLARERELEVRTLDLRSSGDTAGPRDRVVGYGAWSVLAT
jgi:AmmeMemoRadiSam system protein B